MWKVKKKWGSQQSKLTGKTLPISFPGAIGEARTLETTGRGRALALGTSFREGRGLVVELPA